ncbi:MAG: amino acid transporter [Anaerolineaceae bacterium]|nr:MAG: amino acid transporter [Anaerolineaceae bacterium]
MPEQMAFARKASGLVRGLSFLDAFGVGFMNQGLTPSMWVMISFGLGVYTGGNLIIATLLSAVLCGIGFSLVWGILGGSMPRSGGEYIYNSRIIHPIVGIAESFGNAFVWIMWIYVLAPWTVDPGLVMMFQFLNMPAAAEFCTQPIALFLIATLVNLIGLLFVVFGVKVFAKVQKVIMVLGISGCLVILLVFTFTSHDAFVQAWNNLSAQFGSVDYEGFLANTRTAIADAGGKPLSTTWNWFDTLGVMVAGSWLFAYSYCITFIAGEVKRPDKTIILANLSAILVPAVFMIWLAAALYNSVGFEFLSATAWVDNMGEGLAGYTLPWAPNFVGLAAVINHNPFVVFMMAMSFIVFNLWWVALSYLAFPRILFAWGMDRMGPKWFADIDYRWASPVKNHILCFILGEIGIVMYAFIMDPMTGLSVTGMEIVTVFGITAIAALIFPFSKRAKHIWESSPYKNWKILGIPVVSIAAVVNLIYLGILFYFFFFMAEMGEQELVKGSLILYGIIWGLGIAWYFYWKARNKKVGVDTDMTFGELPPD